jgi:hypothetical protein
MKATAGGQLPVVSLRDVAGSDKEIGQLSVLEWYEARDGFKELLVTKEETETVAARLNERGLKPTRKPWAVREYGHAMLVPVLKTDDDGRSGLVALMQVIRAADEAPFNADDEYLAATLAVQFAHCLRRARLLAGAHEQIDQMRKLHSWGRQKLDRPEHLVKLASSLFPCDDVAMFQLRSKQTEGQATDLGASSAKGGKLTASGMLFTPQAFVFSSNAVNYAPPGAPAGSACCEATNSRVLPIRLDGPAEGEAVTEAMHAARGVLSAELSSASAASFLPQALPLVRRAALHLRQRVGDDHGFADGDLRR